MPDASLLLFGKLPSRGDFVRSAHAPAALVHTLDAWLSGATERLAADPRWKVLYDQAAPMDVAFLGSRSRKGLVAHLVASTDASGRRFPFITAAPLDIEHPGPFLARAPLALLPPWHQLREVAHTLLGAPDAGPFLAEMGGTTVACDTACTAWDAGMSDFLATQTVGSLQRLLTGAGHAVTVRTLLLGLGLLLQPLPASGQHRLDRGLALPLPHDALHRPYVASLWLELVGAFLTRSDVEVALFLPQPVQARPAPRLWLGFDGASTRTLHAMLDADLGHDVFIDACAAQWVEEFADHDYAITKLSSYLEQDALSLRQAVATFKETFLGS